MLFTSLPFIVFIAVLFVVYYAFVPHKERWVLLLIASLAFYWFADPRYLIFIGVTALTAYVFAIITENYNAERKAYLKANKEYFDSESKKKYKNKTTCDFYSYDGEYQDSYLLGEPLVIGEDGVVIMNAELPEEGRLLFTFRFTDLYQQHYWSESIQG